MVIGQLATNVSGRGVFEFVGALLALAGLFALVFGFSHAESATWTNGVTLAFLPMVACIGGILPALLVIGLAMGIVMADIIAVEV